MLKINILNEVCDKTNFSKAPSKPHECRKTDSEALRIDLTGFAKTNYLPSASDGRANSPSRDQKPRRWLVLLCHRMWDPNARLGRHPASQLNLPATPRGPKISQQVEGCCRLQHTQSNIHTLPPNKLSNFQLTIDFFPNTFPSPPTQIQPSSPPPRTRP
jgi:hypothetical protein